jgi:hypothetical protein
MHSETLVAIVLVLAITVFAVVVIAGCQMPLR